MKIIEKIIWKQGQDKISGNNSLDKNNILFFTNVAFYIMVASTDSIQFSYINHKCPITFNIVNKHPEIANICCIKIMDFWECPSFMKDLSAMDNWLSNVLSHKILLVTCLLQIKLFQ